MGSGDHNAALAPTERAAGGKERRDVVELYVAERTSLRRQISRIVDPDRAEDLVQETFITYIQRPPWTERPRAWLARVARNRALNDIRRAREVPLVEEQADDDDREAAPEREAVRAVVGRALETLPERARTALTLRYFDERDYEEIAQELAVRVEQAHVIVHRALRRLGTEIVKQLASTHGAERCASALASIAGIKPDGNGHGPTPCDRCRPVWDEIVALRGLQILAPTAGAGAPVGVQRLLEEVAVRVPALPAEPSWVASAAMAVGLALASFGTAGAGSLLDVPAPKAKATAKPRAATRHEVGQRRAKSAGSAERRATSRDRTAEDARPDEVADVGPVRVQQGKGYSQGEGQTPDGQGGGGFVCSDNPLEPCSVPPPEG